MEETKSAFFCLSCDTLGFYVQCNHSLVSYFEQYFMLCGVVLFVCFLIQSVVILTSLWILLCGVTIPSFGKPTVQAHTIFAISTCNFAFVLTSHLKFVYAPLSSTL